MLQQTLCKTIQKNSETRIIS